MHINLKYGIVGGLRTRREFSKKKRYYQYADMSKKHAWAMCRYESERALRGFRSSILRVSRTGSCGTLLEDEDQRGNLLTR